MNKLSYDNHENHCELLKEFYYLNKYLITEQLKDTFLDAIECMEYVITEENEHKETMKPIKYGEWVINEECHDFEYKGIVHHHAMCSNCKSIHDFVDSKRLLKFCPYCGVEMKGSNVVWEENKNE